MKIVTAETAGFCFGVRRAVEICERAAAERTECVTLGPIIHNSGVVAALAKKGVRPAAGLSELPADGTVIIRSHGVGRDEYSRLASTKLNVIDATCPYVAKIHKIVADAYAGGRLPVIIGERAHPEVAAIAGWCAESEIFETPGELAAWFKKFPENAEKPLSVVFQTTETRAVFDNSAEIIKKECTNHQIFDTICNATNRRQQEA
ncbi:MAG: 4-hydroxy-3-methylbut-2-enyl diphosphate reductase, partial [Oscillospiraceae bacterium]|nr:4-hydroxy-3-methylbut-2-enyl diphosphate reductase [Oscillospiraceae bacterium]